MSAPGPTLKQGQYELLEELGKGGMSVVHRARDTRAGAEVAIKVLREEFARDPALRKRFEEEARLMMQIEHANVVQVLDVGEEGELVYIVMEVVDFGSLAEFLALEGPLPPQWASQMTQDVLRGLHVAHDLGITHRDIKPQNILLTSEGVPKLSDFGIARLPDTDATVTGQRLGTPAYMSPEQLKDAKSVDYRTDIYSTAATLYNLVTGREAFDLSSEIRNEVLEDLPTELGEVVKRGTAHHPGDRYASAEEMRLALQDIHSQLSEEPLLLPPKMTAEKPASKIPVDVMRLDPTTASNDPVPDPEDADDQITELDPRPVANRLSSKEQESEEPDEPSPLDRLRELPVPLWFIGVMAASLLAIVGGVGLYMVSSIYAAATAPAEPPVATTVVPTVPSTAHVEAAPAPMEEVPLEALEEEEKKTTRRALGTLSVSSRPTSDVSINGRGKGWNNWSGRVSAGTHTVQLRSGDGQTKTERVRVRAGQTTSYCWDFRNGGECQ